MYDFIIIHGSYGDQYENWFPWLYQKLTEAGKNVLVPQFPCGKGIQNYENWAKVLDAYRAHINSGTSFIGHSLGPAFIADYIVDRDIQVNNLYLAAPFYGCINIPDFDEVNMPFFFNPLSKLNNTKSHFNSAICYISTTDPYVPNQLSIDFAKQIGASIEMVENAGHFNKAAGYSQFMMLFKKMMSDG